MEVIGQHPFIHYITFQFRSEERRSVVRYQWNSLKRENSPFNIMVRSSWISLKNFFTCGTWTMTFKIDTTMERILLRSGIALRKLRISVARTISTMVIIEKNESYYAFYDRYLENRNYSIRKCKLVNIVRAIRTTFGNNVSTEEIWG